MDKIDWKTVQGSACASAKEGLVAKLQPGISGMQDSLVNPAYAATALAAISLGVAIPITLHINRAQAQSSSASSQPSAPSTIQCPN